MITTKHEYENKVAAIHMLRVNAKSLAAEAKIIRQEEMRSGVAYHNMLALHRRGKLREESRYTSLALAFVRGKKYRDIEANGSKPVDWRRLFEKVRRFDSMLRDENTIKDWLA